MPLSVLISKLSTPPLRQKMVGRPALVSQLNQGVQNGFVLISAPAGYGKTTLLTSWLGQTPGTPAWLTLDPADNDLILFLTYLGAALGKADQTIGEAVDNSLKLAPKFNISTILTPLVNQLGKLTQDLYLVLDDYHVIQNTAVHQAVQFLLDHRIEKFKIIIATRTDPPLALSRYRAHSEICELRLDDLRFSSLETEAFLNQTLNLNIAKDDINILEIAAEGWAAGLQMIGLSLKNRQDISSYIQSFSGENRYIIDFFFEEIFSRQDQEIQDFLMKSSILDRMCEALCDQVIGRKDSQAILQYLESSNLFLIPLDEQRQWFRYHPLFQVLLRQQLRKNLPEILGELNLRASQWYEQVGNLTNAIAFAFEAQDYHRTASLIERTADDTFLNGQIKSFLSWVEKLPEEIACQRPLLCVYHAEALLMTGQPVEKIVVRLGEKPEADAVKVLKAAYQGDVGLSRRLSIQVLERLPIESLFLRSVITSALGAVFLLSGEIEPAVETFNSSADIAKKGKNRMLEVIAFCRLGQLSQMRGHSHQAVRFAQKALDLSTQRSGEYFPLASMPLMVLADLKYEWDLLPEGQSLIQEAISLSNAAGGFWSVDCHLIFARVLQAQGESKRALAAMQEAYQLALQTRANPFDDIYTAAYLAKLQLVQGDLDSAIAWAREKDLYGLRSYQKDCVGPRYSPELFHLVELEMITLARLFISLRKIQEALEILVPLSAESQKRERRLSLIENHLLQSQCFLIQGNQDRSIESLKTALDLGTNSGFKRVYLNEIPSLQNPMDFLCRSIEESHPEQQTSLSGSEKLIQDLMTAFKDELTTKKNLDASLIEQDSDVVHTRSERDILKLTQREEEILHFLNQGLSYQEIAAALFIARGTVHKHLKNIYSKLNVHNRSSAVACARELGIIK